MHQHLQDARRPGMGSEVGAEARGTATRRARGRAAFGLVWIAFMLGACESATEGPRAAQTETATNPSKVGASSTASENAWRSPSAAGRYQIGIRPEDGRIPIGPLHAWLVTVETPEGRPAEIRQLVFDGGMPQHGHGFETKPQVTDLLGPGVFRVDGIRFHMAGSWRIRVDVAGDGAADAAVFDVEVTP